MGKPRLPADPRPPTGPPTTTLTVRRTVAIDNAPVDRLWCEECRDEIVEPPVCRDCYSVERDSLREAATAAEAARKVTEAWLRHVEACGVCQWLAYPSQSASHRLYFCAEGHRLHVEMGRAQRRVVEMLAGRCMP